MVNQNVQIYELEAIFKSLDEATNDKLFWTIELVVAVLRIALLVPSETKFMVGKIILKCLRSSKRTFIVANHLEDIVKVAIICASNPSSENIRTGLSMLQILFEVDRIVSEKLLKLGGLNPIIENCASLDYEVLEACSAALFKVVLHGGIECENQLIRHENLMKWYMPLISIYNNKTIKYFAYLTVIYLNTVSRKYHEFFRNGIFDSVILWISEETTYNYLLNNTSFESIDKKEDLTKLMKLLSQRCQIAQTLGSFLFYCEIHKATQRMSKEGKIFVQIGAVKALKRIAFVSNKTARNFACSALQKLSEKPPIVAPDDLDEMSTHHVQVWLEFIELADHGEFSAGIDGKNLFKIKDRELKGKFCMLDVEKRKIFFDELQLLRIMRKLPHQMVQTYSRSEPSSLAIEGAEPIRAIENVASVVPVTTTSLETRNIAVRTPARIKKKIDVFISYRRSTGSELASLLKTYLSFKNYKIFFDVESLRSGNFGESLIKNVQEAKNFVLVLSPNALDRCGSNQEDDDWVRIEIETALKSSCNIIPIVKDFDPKIFDSANFPEDIKVLQTLNWITWHHDTQV